jgi:hypothetical protein
MNIVSDRIGIILKYGKYLGSLIKRYFYIDNDGNLHYTERENAIQAILEETEYDDSKFIKIFSTHNKKLNLKGSYISPIKIYLSEPYQGRSYIELISDNRTIILFSWKDEDIGQLREYIASFNDNVIETEMNFKEAESFVLVSKKSSLSGDIKYMESLIDKKLKNKFVNQNNWQMKYIKVKNPTCADEEYEETWIELDNGSNYSGPVRHGMPHGIGKEYRPDGVLYTGSFFEGKWHGFGTLTLVTLDTYSGEFINGCICGI